MSSLRILISAGPTREPIDPVRFISNRSSGKMGYALAKAAWELGHRVTLISGPVHLVPPEKIVVHHVQTALEMRSRVLKEFPKNDLAIMVAAVADYTPIQVARSKIKKKTDTLNLRLKKTPDILKELGQRKKESQMLVGFAAETSHLLKHALAKLKSKNLDWIIANLVGKPGCGFDSDDNEVTLLSADGSKLRLPRMKKDMLAQKVMKKILSSFPRRKRS